VRRIADMVRPYPFDLIYGAFPGGVVGPGECGGARVRRALHRSRHRRSLDQHRLVVGQW
jgi:hypothetical protein